MTNTNLQISGTKQTENLIYIGIIRAIDMHRKAVRLAFIKNHIIKDTRVILYKYFLRIFKVYKKFGINCFVIKI
jgi:hypothetical protein